MSVSINRQIGSTFVVIGTEVGAGILALPILISHIGFPLGCLVMLVAWALTTYTALLICEVNLAMEDGASFATMAKNLLGTSGQIIVWFSFLFLMYSIMTAYISAAGSAFHTSFNIAPNTVSLIFVLLLGLFVVMGTATVDWINRILLSSKLLLLLYVCITLLPHINASNLLVSPFNHVVLLASLPVFVTSFISHLIIPPIRSYLKSDVKALTRVILIGSAIPLVLYILWIIGIIGVVPFTGANSFQDIASKGLQANVGDILTLMKANLNHDAFYKPVSWFSNISVTTSFLGVSLALYYFLIDGFKLQRLRTFGKNAVATMLTFILPLVVVWAFPNIFIKALGYVGLCCSVLLIIMPFFMIRKLKSKNHEFKIPYINNNVFLYLSLALGSAVVIIQLFFS